MKTVKLIDVAIAGKTPCCGKSLDDVQEMKTLAKLTDTRYIELCECGQLFDSNLEDHTVTFITADEPLV